MDAVLLLASVSDIERTLLGGLVRDVFAAGPHGLWVDLVTSHGSESLLLSAEASLPRIVRGAGRPPKVRPLPPLAGVARRRLLGARLAAVYHRGLDRVVRLDFAPALQGASSDVASSESGGRLVLEAFGNQPNLLLTDMGDIVLEATRHTSVTAARPAWPGAPYGPPQIARRPDPRLLGSTDAVANAIGPLLAAGVAPAQVLRQAFAGVSELWAHEVVARAAAVSAGDLAQALTNLLEVVAAGPPKPYLVVDEAGTPMAVAPTRLVHLPETRQHLQPTLAVALDRVAGHQGWAASVGVMRRLLRRIEERLRTRRAKLQAEAEEFARADAYQRMGQVLIANQGAVTRGATQATLPDHTGEPGATLTVPLDPTLTPAANAERLFRLARRGRRGAMRVARRLADTEVDLRRVQDLTAQAAVLRDPAGFAALRQELKHAPRLVAPKDQKTFESLPADTEMESSSAPLARPAPTPVAARAARERRQLGPEPRRFVSSDGLPILVGRDNEGNDYLTLHLARSEDVWLHVEGFSGSHVLVRMQERSGGIPRQTLVEAAKLAAYYSQARSHGKVAVSYTLKKHVRKPRKAPPGLVTITHEKSLFVTPDKSLITKLAKGIVD